MEGTYPLPEAQLDRFFKLKVSYPSEEAMHGILERTTRDTDLTVTRVVDGAEILQMRHVARSVPIARPVQAYAIRLTLASHPGSNYATALVNRYVRYGASPRRAGARARREDSRPEQRAGVRVGGRHPQRGNAGAAPRILNFEGEARGQHRHHRHRAALQRKRRIKSRVTPNSSASRTRCTRFGETSHVLWELGVGSWELTEDTSHGSPL